MVWSTAASLVAVVAVGLTLASGAGAAVYWTNQTGNAQAFSGTIGRANLDGTLADQNFITGATDPCGVAVDEYFIYWANSFRDEIGSANLDGTGVEQNFILLHETGSPCGITSDGTHIYWGNTAGGNSIGRATIEGTAINENFITGGFTPCSVAVDGTHIYWANSGTNPPHPGSIGRANINGGEVEQEFITGPEHPCGVAVDSSHIYWTNTGDHSIGRATLNGTEVEQEFITGASHPCGVAVSNTHLYWANSGNGTIGRATLNGTEVEQEFITGASHPCGVAVDSVVVLPPPSIAITSPANGATYTQGQAVAAGYSCSAPAGASVAKCTGPVANGAAIDTTTLGQHTFTVNAADSDGQSALESASYTVAAPPPPPPSNNFTIVPRVTCSGICHVILVQISFNSSGNVIAEQALLGQLRASGASLSKKKAKPDLIKRLTQEVSPGSNKLKLTLTAAAQKALRQKGKLKIKVLFTFTPTGGSAKSQVQTFTVKLPKKHKKH